MVLSLILQHLGKLRFSIYVHYKRKYLMSFFDSWILWTIVVSRIKNIPSISCLHALEHFGLGRYGDPVNFEGFDVGFKNIADLLMPRGKLYFSVPIGPQRIEFHAHRVFSLSFLMEMISPFYTIDMFSYVDGQNNFYPDVQLTNELINNNCHCRYGCGIFELIKK